MKVTAEHGENREVTLTIEVDQDKLEQATDGAAKRLAGRVNIPGFRKGKAPRKIVEKVASALGDVFAVLVTGDDGVGAKPDPLPYATAVERLDLRPQDCVVVEDSPTGAASARGNGIHVVQIGATKHFPADPGLVVVPDLASITPHLLLWADR